MWDPAQQEGVDSSWGEAHAGHIQHDSREAPWDGERGPLSAQQGVPSFLARTAGVQVFLLRRPRGLEKKSFDFRGLHFCLIVV